MSNPYNRAFKAALGAQRLRYLQAGGYVNTLRREGYLDQGQDAAANRFTEELLFRHHRMQQLYPNLNIGPAPELNSNDIKAAESFERAKRELRRTF